MFLRIDNAHVTLVTLVQPFYCVPMFQEAQDLANSIRENKRQIRALELEKQRLQYNLIKHDIKHQCPHQMRLSTAVDEDALMKDIPSVTSSSDYTTSVFGDDDDCHMTSDDANDDDDDDDDDAEDMDAAGGAAASASNM